MVRARDRDYRSRNVVAAVLNELWAIELGKLDQIVAFLESRAAGVEIDEAAIRAAMAQRAQSSFDDFLRPLDEREDGRRIADGVEVLSLFDTLGPRLNLMMEFSGGTSTQKFSQQINRAMADDSISSVLVEVDSPGGVVTGTEEARQAVFAARKIKPVVVVARGAMNSAAYYIGSAGSEIIATPSTQVGSLGVYTITRDITKAAEAQGIKFNVFRAGALKASGLQYESLTEDRAKAIAGRIDTAYQQFLASVAENRSISVDTVAKTFGQGDFFFADEAMRRGMIDRVASIEDVFDGLRGRSKSTPAPIVSYPTASEQAAPAFSNPEVSSMNPKIKAANFARGLIGSATENDDHCKAVLNGWFRGKVPSSDEDVIKGLMIGEPATIAQIVAFDSSATPAPASSGAQAAHDREIAEARAAERDRIAAIRARATMLTKTGFAISEQQINAAIADPTLGADEAAGRWIAAGPVAPENSIGRIEPVGSEADNFITAAAEGLVIRNCRANSRALPASLGTPSRAAMEISRMPALAIARRDLQQRGVRVEQYGSDLDVAQDWLESLGSFRIAAADGGVTAASYPNLLSAFLNKSLDTAGALRETTYRDWTAQHPSVPDFNPRIIIGQGSAGYLPEIAGDGDPTPETSTEEEALAWFQTHRRGLKLKLTPVMVVQDSLGAFADSAGKLAATQDKTIDKMCFDLLLSNPVLLDGVALFNLASHYNLPASGAAPSATTAKANRILMRTQPEIGSTDPIELEPRVTLVPDELDEAAKQTFFNVERLTEAIFKTTDATVNIYRDSRNMVIPSQRLSAASAVVWYQFADPRIMPVIKYVYMTGFENGKRESWWDADTQCRYFRHEIAVAVFVAGWRGSLRNPGQ